MEAVHRLLVEQLGVTHLRAIIGFSMGAEQAFQWAVSYPDFSDRIVATSGTAKCWPHGVVRLEAQIAAIQLDPAFKGGDYTAQPKQGVELFALVWAGWLFSQEWWRQELWRQISPPGTTFEAFVAGSAQELHSGRRRQRPHPPGPHLGAARRRHHAGVWRQHREGAGLDQGAGALHAVGDRPVLPAQRRPL